MPDFRSQGRGPQGGIAALVYARGGSPGKWEEGLLCFIILQRNTLASRLQHSLGRPRLRIRRTNIGERVCDSLALGSQFFSSSRENVAFMGMMWASRCKRRTGGILSRETEFVGSYILREAHD